MTNRSPAKLLLLSIAAIAAASVLQSVNAQALNEDMIKANYVLRFTDFVRWQEPTGEVIRIAMLGEDNMKHEIMAAAKSRSNRGRVFEVIIVKPDSITMQDIDLIYIGRGYRNQWPGIIESSRRASVVTVASEPGFLKAGGLIEFVKVQNRLRFSLNMTDVDSYDVTISSKLVQLSVLPGAR